MEKPERTGVAARQPDNPVFLFDLDNTLLDNDRIEQDLSARVAEAFGEDGSREYWRILEQLRDRLDYVDHLGALERFRLDHLHDPKVLRLSSWLIDYPYAERLFPCALAAIGNVRRYGPAVILSDGDAVLQPRKVDRSGLWDAVNGNVLIFIHKENMLADVERLYPAHRYVLVDDKLRVLTEVKKAWGERAITVWPRQGHYAHEPEHVSGFPPADISVEQIAELCGEEWLRPILKPGDQETR